MDPRTAAAQPHTLKTGKVLSLIEVSLDTREVGVPADAAVLGVTNLVTSRGDAAQADLGIIALVSDGAALVRRKVQVAKVGDSVSVESQNGEYLGEVYLPPADQGQPPVVAVVFLETQRQAVERSKHVRLPPP